MELNFKKDKERIAGLSDARLIALIRDPSISANDRMLAEAEISRRNLDRHRVAVTRTQVETPAPPRSGAKLIPILIMLGVFGSVLVGILDDMGIDIIQWLRDLFSG